jgi:ferric-dicitrate binding protein FerR (iron transport regulator)
MIEDDLLKKWLNDELTTSEKEVFSKQNDYAINLEIIEKAKHFKASQFSKVDDYKTFEKSYQNNTRFKNNHWLRPLLRIASILIITFGVYFTFFNSDKVEIKTLLAEKTTLSLPDLSEVLMNADSEITYNEDFWDANRNLNLNGEAYFKVAKGKTFNVKTTNGTITVVGTEFNVKSRKNYFEVICYEGVVNVTSDTIVRQLKASETFRILNKKFTQDKVIDTEPQWTSNRSNFKVVPLKEVFAELERQYNVKVVINSVDASRLFTGGFVNNNIKNALNSITKPMNLTFEISSSNQVLIHGSKN